jgi:hypothetical protein
MATLEGPRLYVRIDCDSDIPKTDVVLLTSANVLRLLLTKAAGIVTKN